MRSPGDSGTVTVVVVVVCLPLTATVNELVSAPVVFAAANRAAAVGVNVNVPLAFTVTEPPEGWAPDSAYVNASLSWSVAVTVPVTTPVLEFGVPIVVYHLGCGVGDGQARERR